MIVVAPLHKLDEAIARWRPSHIVSLASPGAQRPSLPREVETLVLTFHDIVEPRPGLEMAAKADVAAILTFGASWSGARPLLVHCWAGVSRSPAVAYVIACAKAPKIGETEMARRLRRDAPFATPNAHVVALADEMLGRDGAMTSAIAALGRGAETSVGASFCLMIGPEISTP